MVAQLLTKIEPERGRPAMSGQASKGCPLITGLRQGRVTGVSSRQSILSLSPWFLGPWPGVLWNLELLTQLLVQLRASKA